MKKQHTAEAKEDADAEAVAAQKAAEKKERTVVTKEDTNAETVTARKAVHGKPCSRSQRGC